MGVHVSVYTISKAPGLSLSQSQQALPLCIIIALADLQWIMQFERGSSAHNVL